MTPSSLNRQVLFARVCWRLRLVTNETTVLKIRSPDMAPDCRVRGQVLLEVERAIFRANGAVLKADVARPRTASSPSGPACGSHQPAQAQRQRVRTPPDVFGRRHAAPAGHPPAGRQRRRDGQAEVGAGAAGGEGGACRQGVPRQYPAQPLTARGRRHGQGPITGSQSPAAGLMDRLRKSRPNRSQSTVARLSPARPMRGSACSAPPPGRRGTPRGPVPGTHAGRPIRCALLGRIGGQLQGLFEQVLRPRRTRGGSGALGRGQVHGREPATTTAVGGARAGRASGRAPASCRDGRAAGTPRRRPPLRKASGLSGLE